MNLETYFETPEFALFLDEELQRKAENSAEEIHRRIKDECHGKRIRRTQLQSIPSILQATGISGLVELAGNQKSKNTKEENKRFWDLIHQSLSQETGENSFRHLGKEVLAAKGFWHDPATASSKSEQGAIKTENKKALDAWGARVADVYFEHFVNHFIFINETTEGKTDE